MAIEGGRLLRAAPLADFTTTTGVVRVELDDDPAPFARRLDTAGLAHRVDGFDVLVDLGGSGDYDLVRDAVAELGLGLVRIEPERRTLEDLFR